MARRTRALIAPDIPLSGANATDEALAREICEELGGLPLALDQAGAYIEETQVRSVHAKPWQHGGCVAGLITLTTNSLTLGEIPNLLNGQQTAVPSL